MHIRRRGSVASSPGDQVIAVRIETGDVAVLVWIIVMEHTDILLRLHVQPPDMAGLGKSEVLRQPPMGV